MSAAPPRTGERAVRRDPGPALTRYRVFAIATGVMLLLLCVELVVKYGFLDGQRSGWDVIASVHGWVYFVYLITVADLWSKLRWPFGRLLVLLLCGVVPLLSFWAERRVVAEVRAGRTGDGVPAALRGPRT